MTTYIGEIPIPYISSFEVDRGAKTLNGIAFLGKDTLPYLSEYPDTNLRTFSITGTLLQDSGVTSNIDDMAEDLLGLRDRLVSSNYIHNFQGRSGWLGVRETDSPKTANSLVTREFSIDGMFLPKSLYRTRMHSNSIIRSNNFAFALGTDDCDNYIAIPIGATYSGGDGSSISRTSKDGTITLVLATSDSNIEWDIGEADRLNGECKIFDEKGVSEANWVQVYARDREFTGKLVVENALYRMIFDPSTEYITIYYWSGSAYTKIDDFTCGTYTRFTLVETHPDIIRGKLDSGVEFELRRGHPPMIDTDTDDLLAVALTPANQSTSTENYLILGTSLYICSNENFTIVNSTKNLGAGKKWIFYETVSATAEDIAHQAMVDARMNRELIQR
ncbi:MAG: hypothetical protein KAS66_08185 [Candidatus Omnitrophica bacterium]|nr:hypothetical protein [Candidatus Omnitrophota bacterium]